MVLNPIHEKIIAYVNELEFTELSELELDLNLFDYAQTEITKAISECVQDRLIQRLEYMRKNEQTRRCIYYSSDIKLMF